MQGKNSEFPSNSRLLAANQQEITISDLKIVTLPQQSAAFTQ
jgi:hypothetical protein